MPIQTEDFYDEKIVEEEKKRFICFTLAQESFGLSIDNAKEIVNVPLITHVPGAPDHILGIINLRGNILSVTDLKKIFGLASTIPSNSSNKIIVIEVENKETGILVDSVEDAVDIPVATLDAPMATLSGSAAEYIEAECEYNKKLTGILKAEKLFL